MPHLHEFKLVEREKKNHSSLCQRSVNQRTESVLCKPSGSEDGREEPVSGTAIPPRHEMTKEGGRAAAGPTK